jgi:hypothetical protein
VAKSRAASVGIGFFFDAGCGYTRTFLDIIFIKVGNTFFVLEVSKVRSQYELTFSEVYDYDNKLKGSHHTSLRLCKNTYQISGKTLPTATNIPNIINHSRHYP